MEDLLPEAEEPFNIPIYLCDSLLNSELDKMDFEKRMKFAVQLAGKKFELPIIESLSDDRFDSLIDYIDDLTHNYSKKDLTESKIKELISKKISGYLSKAAPEYDELLNSTVSLTMALHEKVLNHENTIWSFVLKNNFRPIVFNKTIDIVVGNPPWLTFKDVKSDDYRKELEDLGLRQHKIAPMSGKLRTHMELATIFLTHAVDSYLKENGNLYFVLPRSLFSADHHSNFREQTYTLDMKVEEIWDLFDVSPLFRVPSCVIVASHNKKSSAKKYTGRILKAKFPEQNVSYEKAASLLNEKVKDFYCVRMGSWSALSEKNISIKSQDKFYQDKFKQGATLLPRSFYFVETSDKSHATKKSVPIKTATSAKKNAKKPYHKIDMLGRANTKFLFNTLIAENIIPFGVVSPFLVHLPVVKSKTDWNSCTYHKMLEDGYKDSSDWFKDVETTFNKLAKGTMTPFERLNFHNGLLSQNPMQKIWVIYCAAGTNVCASVYFNKEKLFVEHKNYWFCPSSKEEAYYLCGVLNSEFANLLIKPFQTKGLLGERDIEKKILGIGIPQFSKSNKAMIAISKKAETLTRKVESNLLKFNAKSVGKRRSQVREHFKNEFSEIDVLVTSLFTKSK